MSNLNAPAISSRYSRYVIFLIIFVFLILNILNLKDLSLIDWDEGAFALQAKWLASSFAEGKPFNFQTPPLFQIIIALLFRLLSFRDWILLLVSMLSSALTIFIVFKLAKMLDTTETGIYSVLLLVFTEFFLFFSKSGLSDATFTFFFISAMYFFYQGIKSNQNRQFIFAGLFCLLALYTKYSAPALLIILFIVGFINCRKMNAKWFLFTIVLPIILYLPYLAVFLKIVSVRSIGERHLTLLGMNHFKFLYYLFVFAPIPLVLSVSYAIIAIVKKKWTQQYKYVNVGVTGNDANQSWGIGFVVIPVIIFFIIVGFYHPYFRLAYPMVPLLSIIGAQLLKPLGKLKHYTLVFLMVISFILGWKTIAYCTDIPKQIAKLETKYVELNHSGYILTTVPPNVLFYLNGHICFLVKDSFIRLGTRYPELLNKRIILNPERNRLVNQDQVLLIHCTIFDSIKTKYKDLFATGILIDTLEFMDAPVYYKDIFNPLRDQRQIYELYVFFNNFNRLWQLGSEPIVEIISP